MVSISSVMISFSMPFLIWMLCVPSIHASTINPHHVRAQSHNRLRNALPQDNISTQTWSPIQIPSPISQGMLITSIIPLYEICSPLPSKTNISTSTTTQDACTPVYTTITEESCSTTLTYAFTTLTITQCLQNITFSTHHDYILTSSTTYPSSTSPPSGITSLPTSTPEPSLSTYIQSVTSYYLTPWQSLASNNPSNITLKICFSPTPGQETCNEIKEIWEIHSEDIVVISTSTIQISTTLSSTSILLLSPSKTLTLQPGPYSLSTEIEHTSLSTMNVTSILTLGEDITSTTTRTTAITITGYTTTITRTLRMVN